MCDLVRRSGLYGLLFVAIGLTAQAAVPAQGEAGPKPNANANANAKKPIGLRVVDPVVCKSIDGYEEYEPLPEARQTSEEKLLVYYRPKGYKIVHKGDSYIARFAQDGQVRPLGGKKVLLRKPKLLNYEAKSDVPPDEIYFQNTFSLKGLPPGDYEYDVILRDLNANGATAKQSVKFHIIAPKSPSDAPETDPRTSRNSTPVPAPALDAAGDWDDDVETDADDDF